MLWGLVLCTSLMVSNWLVGDKRRQGFLLGAATEALWFYWALFVLAPVDWGFVVFSLVFMFVHTRNFLKWKKEEVAA